MTVKRSDGASVKRGERQVKSDKLKVKSEQQERVPEHKPQVRKKRQKMFNLLDCFN